MSYNDEQLARRLSALTRVVDGLVRAQQVSRSIVVTESGASSIADLLEVASDAAITTSEQAEDLTRLDESDGYVGDAIDATADIDDALAIEGSLGDLIDEGSSWFDQIADADEAVHVAHTAVIEAEQNLEEARVQLEEKIADARATLDAAEGRLTDAETRLTESEQNITGMQDDITSAVSDAAAAQIDANLAKGLLSVKPSAPVAADGQGKPIGAFWIHHAAAGIQTMYEWTALGWVPRPLSETIIPKVAIGTGTYGELDGVRLKANSVLAKSIAVGDFTNYASIDPVRGVDVTIPSEYSTKNDGVYTTRGTGAQNYIMMKDRTDALPFKGGEQLRVTFRAKATVSSSVAAVVWAYPAKAGGSAAGNVSAASSPIAIGTTESEFSAVIAIPAGFGGSATLQSWIAGLRPGSGVDMANVSVRDVRMVRMASGELLVDGAVGAQHVATGTLQALAATITEAWIRNAHIVEVDVSKLNVTGTASMKQAVIDEIWTNAVVTKMLTATEKIITKDIIAVGAIDGMTITGALFRTAASGQRIQMDSLGIRAFNSSGVVTSSLTARPDGFFVEGGLMLKAKDSGGTATSPLALLTADGLSLVKSLTSSPHSALLTPGELGLGSVSGSGGSTGQVILRSGDARNTGGLGMQMVSNQNGGDFVVSVGTPSSTYPQGTVWLHADRGDMRVGPSGFNPSGKLHLTVIPSFEGDTDWSTFSISGWIIQDSAPPQVRVRRGNVEFRGVLSNATFEGGFTTVGNLPAHIPKPPGSYAVGDIGMNSPTNTKMRITTGGAVQFYRASPSGAWVNLKATSYAID